MRKELDLQVTRPPIIAAETPSHISVVEGQAASLYCKAEGFPKPDVKWRRENDELFSRGVVTRYESEKTKHENINFGTQKRTEYENHRNTISLIKSNV